MRNAFLARIQLGVLALAGLLGFVCDGSEPQAGVRAVPESSSVGTYSEFAVEICVTSSTAVQAFDLGLRWDPEMLSAIDVFPHPEFDDDGAFFTSPRYDNSAGTLERLVDLRHGGVGTQGNFNVATVWFMTRGRAGLTSIEPTSRGLASPDGTEPLLTLLPVTITIGP